MAEGSCGIFFFFKQKTAYEIYQCDWSSDVCSSDLCAAAGVVFIGPTAAAIRSMGSKSAAKKIMEKAGRSEERRVGKSVDLGGRRIIKKKNKK